MTSFASSLATTDNLIDFTLDTVFTLALANVPHVAKTVSPMFAVAAEITTLVLYHLASYKNNNDLALASVKKKDESIADQEKRVDAVKTGRIPARWATYQLFGTTVLLGLFSSYVSLPAAAVALTTAHIGGLLSMRIRILFSKGI